MKNIVWYMQLLGGLQKSIQQALEMAQLSKLNSLGKLGYTNNACKKSDLNLKKTNIEINLNSVSCNLITFVKVLELFSSAVKLLKTLQKYCVKKVLSHS